MTDHTPGPWTASISDSARIEDRITAADGTPVFVGRCANSDNALLMAAAPDLLAALEAAVPALIRLGDFVGNVDPGGISGLGQIDRCALILQARQAINKAKDI